MNREPGRDAPPDRFQRRVPPRGFQRDAVEVEADGHNGGDRAELPKHEEKHERVRVVQARREGEGGGKGGGGGGTISTIGRHRETTHPTSTARNAEAGAR